MRFLCWLCCISLLTLLNFWFVKARLQKCLKCIVMTYMSMRVDVKPWHRFCLFAHHLYLFCQQTLYERIKLLYKFSGSIIMNWHELTWLFFLRSLTICSKKCIQKSIFFARSLIWHSTNDYLGMRQITTVTDYYSDRLLDYWKSKTFDQWFLMQSETP